LWWCEKGGWENSDEVVGRGKVRGIDGGVGLASERVGVKAWGWKLTSDWEAGGISGEFEIKLGDFSARIGVCSRLGGKKYCVAVLRFRRM